MAISFVGVSTMWSSSASSTSFTINKPAGTLADGDLMIAVLTWTTGSTATDLSCTVPSGWTKQDEIFNGGDGWDHQMCVMTRFYVSGDPSTWSGTLSSTQAKVKVSTVAAYRGVQSIAVKGTASVAGPSTTSYSTATVNNPSASNWRFVCAGYESSSLTYSMNTNEVTSRALNGDSNSGSADFIQLRIADSGAAIATGNTSRTVSRSAAFDASTAWIGILAATTGTPATGDMAMTLGRPTVSAAGEVHDDATMSMTLGAVQIAADGFGTPPVVSGTMGMTLSPVTADGAGTLPVSGSMDMLMLPRIQINTETRVSGVRVIVVEAEDRVIRVPSRGVDD